MSETTNRVDLPVLSGDGVNEFFNSGNIASCDLNRKIMESGEEGPSLSSKLRTKMEMSNAKGPCVAKSTSPQTVTATAASPGDQHSPIHRESLYTFRFNKSKDNKRKSTDATIYKNSKSRKTSEGADVGTHGRETSEGADVGTHCQYEVLTSDEDKEAGPQATSSHSNPAVMQGPSHHSNQTQDLPSGQTTDTDSVEGETEGDKGDPQHGDKDGTQGDITDPPGGSREPIANSSVLADGRPDMSEDPPEGRQSSPGHSSDAPPGDISDIPGGVVRLGKQTESGLPMYINSVGVTFAIDLTDEAMDYIRDLTEQAKNGKPPTVSKLKYLTVQALEQLIKYNDRPLYNLGTHPELAATVADYIKNGVPPRCPKCKRGALRFSNGKKRHGKKYYWCPGYSPNGFHFYGCNFKAPREEITRIPFVYPK